MSAWLAPGRYHHCHRVAGHDAEENEHDDRDPRERGEPQKKTPQDRESDHRLVINLTHSPIGAAAPEGPFPRRIIAWPLRPQATQASAAKRRICSG